VKSHVKAIFAKMNVISRTEAVASATPRGLIQLYALLRVSSVGLVRVELTSSLYLERGSEHDLIGDTTKSRRRAIVRRLRIADILS
jgi:hypothetical protein